MFQFQTMLQTVLLLLSISVVPSLQQTAECSSPPMPDIGGTCPATTTFVTGGCCPDTDLIAAPVVTSTTVVTDPTASTTTASTVTVTSRTVTTTTCVDLVNPRTGVSDCPAMASFCTNALYLNVMRVQCRRTCGFCTTTTGTSTSTCVDLTNPATGVSDCPQRTALCTNSAYTALMRVQCPRTCGFCTTTTGTTGTVTTTTTGCADLVNPATGVSECSQRAALCTNSAYITLMRTQCPRTCGFCTTTNTTTTTTNGTCVDLTNPATGVSDCPQRTALCTNSAYITLMRTQCPRSCGFCTSNSTSTTASTSSTTASSTCVDLTNPATGTSDCAQRTIYCNNPTYLSLMRQQCPRTCGFCTVG